MKRALITIVILLLASTIYARNERDTLGVGTAVYFTGNLGQWDAAVRYEAQLHDAALFLHDDGLTVLLRSAVPHPATHGERPHYHAYRMTFAGVLGTSPSGEDKHPGYSNYYLGNNPGRWRAGVPSYATLRYTDLWPGIDLELYSATRALKYNFIVHPGADAAVIAIDYDGTDGVSLSTDGTLRVRTTVRDIVEMQPYVYQLRGGDTVVVTSRWQVERTKQGCYRATVAVGAYDHSLDLVVDPVLIFSTYTGSTADNWGTTAAYDSHKQTYTAGLVFNMGYPTSLGALDSTFNGTADVGIFKFDTLGNQRLYATYLGGSQADMPHSLFVNAFDQLLVFGTTGSTDFPVTAGAYQTTHGGGTTVYYENTSTIPFPSGSDIFVSRLSADGRQLQASTYVGGSGNDGLNYRQRYNQSYSIIMAGNDSLYYNYGDGARGEIITDNLNNVYIGSTTESHDFPTTDGAVQRNWSNGQDGIVVKLDHNLRNMLWCTYLGGLGDDAVYSIDLDSNYNILVCGGTNSQNFPVTAGAYQTTYGGGSADGFVSKLSSDGSRLMASTYLGARFYDQIYFVRTGRHDEVFLFGQTEATGNTMIHNAGYSVYGSGMLLVRMLPDLSARRWSTVFGTSGRVNLSPTAFAADICNRVYAAGWGRDFVGYNGVQWYSAGTHGMETTTTAYQDTTDGQDFYIISLDADANRLEYATFFGELHQNGGSTFGGGDHVDGGTSRFDRLATLYQSVCASCGGTNRFPTSAGAWSDSNRASNCNNAVFRFEVTDDFPVAEFIPPEAGCAPYTIHFNNTGRGTSYHWDFGDGTTSTQRSPTHTYSAAGIYTITLVAAMPGGCSEADTQRHTVQVLSQTGSLQVPRLSCNGASIQIGPQPQLGATYHWLSGAVSDPTVANPWVSDEGTYILRINATGCTQTDTFIVQTYNLVQNLSLTAITCHDSADGSATFVLGNAISPDSLTVTLTPAATPVVTASDITFSGLAAGNYHIVISGYGCSYEHDFELRNPSVPMYTKEVSTPLCTDSCDGWIHLTYDFSAIPEVPRRDTIISGLCEGSYITHLVTNEGCPIIDTTQILRDRQLDTSLSAWVDDSVIFLGESTTLHASVNGDADGITYIWSPAADIDRPTTADPTVTPTDTLACYTVTATTANGCRASDTVCLHCTTVICGAPLFTFPNAFTPNGDGVNDRLCFNSDELLEFHIAIFNRWGERVYESDDPTRCWDGTYRGSACMPGVYTYTCHIRCHADKENDFKGDITLIR